MKFWFVILALCAQATAVEIVTENQHPACEELHLARGLNLYKDPMLFIAHSQLVDAFKEETPVLTTLTGTVQLMRLGPPAPFRNFGAIAKVYELAVPKLRLKKEKGRLRLESSPLVVPVKICGDGQPYTDTLGFVLLSDLRDSQLEDYEPGTMPPSTVGNPIPRLPSKN